MLAFAYAPSVSPPPELYARYTWVKELGLTWQDLGGIDTDEIGLLAEMVNVQHEAQEIRARADEASRR